MIRFVNFICELERPQGNPGQVWEIKSLGYFGSKRSAPYTKEGKCPVKYFKTLKEAERFASEDFVMQADPGTAFIDTFEDKPDENKPSQNELIHRKQQWHI